MPEVNDSYSPAADLVLGVRINDRVPASDQKRQHREVVEILRRLQTQPGVILADEVGMGKTFVALGIACSIALRSPRGPVIIMVPANLIDKWEQDLKSFCELYLENRRPVRRDSAKRHELTRTTILRYGVARHSVSLMKLLDDPPKERCHLIFLTQGAMNRAQTDKWVRLALIAEAFRRHGCENAKRLVGVKTQIHRFLAELLGAIGEERASDQGPALWQHLLQTDPRGWKNIYNQTVPDEGRQLDDDPVPKPVIRALRGTDLKPLAEALEGMPVHARGGGKRVSERLNGARRAMRAVEDELWKKMLAQVNWRSPLLVMDEAHHLKNPDTSLARQLQSHDAEQDLRTGDGAMAKAFDRMLFLTATPFQLGHHELMRVLERFGDVRWNANELGNREAFCQQIKALGNQLNESQHAAIAFQRYWSRLQPEDCALDDLDAWWHHLHQAASESLNSRQRAVVGAYNAAKLSREDAEQALKPWIVRHNKGTYWAETRIERRSRVGGGAVVGLSPSGGLPIPPEQMLPFFLAARSAINPGQDLLGEALCSSFEAFRDTRQNRGAAKDELDDVPMGEADLSRSRWYLEEFDRSLKNKSGSIHPKVHATVQKTVDLWEAGEKVLIFAFYRHTCRWLRIHISDEIERRLKTTGVSKHQVAADHADGGDDINRILERIQKRFFDDPNSPGRRELDKAIAEILRGHAGMLERKMPGQKETIKDVMRRFLRVPTTLVRYFPLVDLNAISPAEAIVRMLDHEDASKVSWRRKFDHFLDFLIYHCTDEERQGYLEAALQIQTGSTHVVNNEEGDDCDRRGHRVTLANIKEATGGTDRDTRTRLMRAFNTPFFPDILICSEVMGEGVDLHRFCRHVIHHDLAWNPSTIEQRTGRIDRLGCKAEAASAPIFVYLPYLAGAADERQFRVMSDREQWFRVVMGQNEVARLIAPDAGYAIPLPRAISDELGFKLDLGTHKIPSTSRRPDFYPE